MATIQLAQQQRIIAETTAEAPQLNDTGNTDVPTIHLTDVNLNRGDTNTTKEDEVLQKPAGFSGATEDNWILENGLEGCACYKMNTGKDKFESSFKISAPANRKKEVMSSDLWPSGITINHFLNLQRRQPLNTGVTLPTAKLSIKNKSTVLEAVLAEEQSHIVCITEHWMKQEEIVLERVVDLLYLHPIFQLLSPLNVISILKNV
ncbi:hypothetical protein JTB14_011737 [Gonioctena quinquepunctata]|nr:hypothetical protein JTB14_011737 [Gonioctena quinquepunctata]